MKPRDRSSTITALIVQCAHIAVILTLLFADAGDVVAASEVIAVEAFDYASGELVHCDKGLGWKNAWRTSRPPVAAIVARPVPTEASDAVPVSGPRQMTLLLSGTGARNNPVRRELKQPVSVADVFVRFSLRYRNPHQKSADPEFFVLWLDQLEGGDRSTHAAGIPNIGVHVADRGPLRNRNVFMVRIGSTHTAWSEVELLEDRVYQVVGRLSKSESAEAAEYDRLDLWIDPQLADVDAPDATVSGVKSISLIRWIGFSTGLKTEPADEFHVKDLVLSTSWESILDQSGRMIVDQRTDPDTVVWSETVDFKTDVYPLLKSRCFECHSGPSPESGFRLDVHRELLGYSTGEVLAEAGRARHSRLIEAVSADDVDKRMPPEGTDPLTEEQIAMLRAWIDQGMTWDDELLPTPTVRSDHWAFQPVSVPVVPVAAKPAWVRTPVDAFVAEAHSRKQLQHSPEASRHVLVRRLYLDLIGMSPTPEQVAEFVDDRDPDAYESLVDRVLSSPHYGERWARYWLDLARWAESQGYQHDIIRPYAWRYRDYVIDSFNNDKPYDRFLKEQLAGDELQPYSDENLIATGFLGAARISGNQEDDAIQRNDVMVDIVNATGSVMLGLTMECAQCHNHKFDPISQRDYYRLQSFFVNGQLGNLSLREAQPHNPTDMQQWVPKAAYDFYAKEVKALLRKKLFTPTQDPHTWGFHSPATSDPAIRRLPVVNRKPIAWQPAMLKNAVARLLMRGDVARPGPRVRSGWPEVLGQTPNSLGEKPRSQLADWMSSPRNPLVSRVWVNRIWQYHFGRGIVATASDFGVGGAPPTHPELLDWLAGELMNHNWSTKHIHRQIVQSSTYRQQRLHSPANASIDPDNRFLWCWPRRRLEAEAIRDSVLVASDELVRSVGGVSIPAEREEEELRRTIYLFQQRSSMPSVMQMFDAPNGTASCSRRPVSTVALQPLFLLNSDFMARRAARLADIVSDIAGDDPDLRIQVAFERVLTRRPDAEEIELARQILQQPRDAEDDQKTPIAGSPLTQFCHALLNLNEFVYIP